MDELQVFLWTSLCQATNYAQTIIQIYYKTIVFAMPVMLQMSYFFPASLSLRTTRLLMQTWISELPEAFTCFIDPPPDYSNNGKADFPSKEINTTLD